MALSCLRDLFLVTLVIGVSNGFDLNLEAYPNKLNPSHHQWLQVTCVSEDPGSETLYWEMGIVGFTELATVEDQQVMLKADNVKGIYKDCLGNSKCLTLTIQDPNVTYAGTYYCRQSSYDEEEYTSVLVSKAEIEIELESNYAIPYLLEKIHYQEFEFDDYSFTLNEQYKKMEEQASIIKDQQSKIRLYEYRIEQNAGKIDDLEEKDSHLNTSISKCLSLVGDQQKRLDESVKQKGGTIQDNYTVAFSYGYSNKDVFTVDRNVIFREEILKVGEGYDPKTGEFTCSRDGLYVFHLSIVTYTWGDFVNLDIRVNNEIKSSLTATGKRTHDQAAVSTIVSIKAGDKVRVYVKRFRGKKSVLTSISHYSVFSGYSLKLT